MILMNDLFQINGHNTVFFTFALVHPDHAVFKIKVIEGKACQLLVPDPCRIQGFHDVPVTGSLCRFILQGGVLKRGLSFLHFFNAARNLDPLAVFQA